MKPQPAQHPTCWSELFFPPISYRQSPLVKNLPIDIYITIVLFKCVRYSFHTSFSLRKAKCSTACLKSWPLVFAMNPEFNANVMQTYLTPRAVKGVDFPITLTGCSLICITQLNAWKTLGLKLKRSWKRCPLSYPERMQIAHALFNVDSYQEKFGNDKACLDMNKLIIIINKSNNLLCPCQIEPLNPLWHRDDSFLIFQLKTVG